MREGKEILGSPLLLGVIGYVGFVKQFGK